MNMRVNFSSVWFIIIARIKHTTFKSDLVCWTHDFSFGHKIHICIYIIKIEFRLSLWPHDHGLAVQIEKKINIEVTSWYIIIRNKQR